MKSPGGIFHRILLAEFLFFGICFSQRLQQYRQEERRPEGRSDTRSSSSSSSSWPSSETLWSDIPKSDHFDLRNWKQWKQGASEDDDDSEHHHQGSGFQSGKKPFKRHIPTSHNNHKENFDFGHNLENKDNFYPSPPISNPSFQPGPGSGPHQGNPYQEHSGAQPFNFGVQYNEGDDDEEPPPNFKRSPLEGAAPSFQQQGNYPSSSFTPSFGGPAFPTSVEYNPETQNDLPGGFYGQEDHEIGVPRGQPSPPQPQGYDFTSHFGEPTDKEGRIKAGGVSQSYSTYTGPDGQRTGFFVKDHNSPNQPNEQIKQQIESSIHNLQGKLNPGEGPGGHTFGGRPQTFGDDEEDEEDNTNFVDKRSPFRSPEPTTVFADTDRFKRGSHTNEKFHQADKNAGEFDSQKNFRQPLQKIQYNRQVPDTENKNYGDNYAVVKTFKGGYSSDDKDAHLRPPPTYNYELIDDEDGEGKFEQQQSDEGEERPNKHKFSEPEDYYVPKEQPEERVRPKYEEMTYEDRRGRGRNIKERDDDSAQQVEDEEEEQEQEQEEESPKKRKVTKSPKRPQRQKVQKGKKEEITEDGEEETNIKTWIWDPSTFKLQS